MRIGLRTKVAIALVTIGVALTASSLLLVQRGQEQAAAAVVQRVGTSGSRATAAVVEGFAAVRGDILAGSRAAL
ncbi:MAG: hypothetical protein J0M02_14080, partial [Planctomycetes bacterium]|nr:hypothetical protein [Planctomycetota bacterium]